MLAKQNTATLSANDNTKDTIAIPENSRRSSGSGAFSVKRAKMGDPDFDYSALNTNLRYYINLFRLRDLESKMVDLKGDMERRILQIIEESPMKFLHHLKNVEEKETTMWAENIEKHNKNSEALVIQQARSNNHAENIGSRMLSMQRQLEDLSFKNVELERNLQNLTRHNRDLLDNNMNALEIKQQAGRDTSDLSMEMKFLKDRLASQEDTKNRFIKDISSQMENLNAVVLRNENDLYTRLREQKKQFLEEAFGGKDQMKKIEEMRMEKMMGDNEYMKSLMDTLERKVKAEMTKRLSSEQDQKGWLDMQFQTFKDEIKADQRDMLENQNNLVKEVQESISSMNSIMRNTREELMATTNSNQLLMTENMRNLTKALEVIKNSTLDRVANLDQAMVDLNSRMELTNEAFNENAIKVTQAMENEFGRVDRIMTRFEDLVNESNKTINERIVQSEERQKAWKDEYEDKNHNIFKEMSNSLKALKRQIVKTTKDSEDRDKDIEKQISDSKILAEGMFKNLDEKANHLESVYAFNLEQATKVWGNNLQMEVDKVLDAISKNTEAVQTDLLKRITVLKSEVNKAMYDNVDKEVGRLRDLLADTRKDLEEGTISKLKDVELRLESLFRSRFEEYRHKLDDSIREFNRLKNEMEHIKNDYLTALENLKEDMKANTKRECETLKSQLVNRIKENKEQVDEIIDNNMKVFKQEVELNKEDMHRSVEAAKLDIDSSIKTTANDLKNMVDKNDQIIHGEVNAKMNSLNTEIGTMKKYLVERMDEIHESTKSLARALVNEEAANRANKDEMIIKMFDRKIANLNSFIMSLVEQKLDEVRIALENKIKDAMLDFEAFKRFTLDEFSKVRTEHEYFKQEFYAREYSDYLYLLTFQDQVSCRFEDVQGQFYQAHAEMDKIRQEANNKTKDFENKIDKEIKERKEEGTKLKKEHDKYKELNERTWEEYLTHYEADLLGSKCSLAVMEEAVYETIHKMVAYIETLGGGAEEIEKKLKETNKNLEIHKKSTVKQDKDNEARFKVIEKNHGELSDHYEQFQKVTKNNFEITEEALSVLSGLINSIDSQVNAEKMINMATLTLMEGRTAAEVAELDGRVRLLDKDNREQGNEALKKAMRHIEEEVIPKQILSINKSMNEANKSQNEGVKSLAEQLQQKISEHSIALDKHDQRLKFAEENIKDAGDDMKKIEHTIHTTNAHILGDHLHQEAELSHLKKNIAHTIGDIFKVINDMEKAASDAEATDVSPADFAKVKGRLDKVEKKFEDVNKQTDKLKEEMGKVKDAAGDGALKGKKSKKSDEDDHEGASKAVKDLKKEVDLLKKEMEALKKEKGSAKGKDKDAEGDEEGEEEGEEEEEDKPKKKGKKPVESAGGDSKEFKSLQKQVAQLQKQIKDLEEKVEVLEEGKAEGDEEGDEEEEKPKSKGKKASKNKNDDKDDEDEDEAEEKVTKEMLEEKLQELKDELMEEINKKGGEEEGEDEDDDEDKPIKGKGKKKGKKGKEEEDDEEGNNEKLEELEERIKELEEQMEKKEGKDDEEKEEKEEKEVDEEKLNELEEKLNEKIEEINGRLEELENKEEKEEKEEDAEEKGGDMDEKIQEKIDELKESLKQEIKDELNEEKGEDEDGEKGGNTDKLWDEVKELKEKMENVESLPDKLAEIEEKMESLEEKIESIEVHNAPKKK